MVQADEAPQYSLSERQQRTAINGKCIGWERVSTGVPQGSILGLLFFLIYISTTYLMNWNQIFVHMLMTRLYSQRFKILDCLPILLIPLFRLFFYKIMGTPVENVFKS